jgi:hypothetical protein
VVAPLVKDIKGWVEKSMNVMRSEYRMKLSVAAAQLGLCGVRAQGIGVGSAPCPLSGVCGGRLLLGRVNASLEQVPWDPELTPVQTVKYELSESGSRPRSHCSCSLIKVLVVITRIAVVLSRTKGRLIKRLMRFLAGNRMRFDWLR